MRLRLRPGTPLEPRGPPALFSLGRRRTRRALRGFQYGKDGMEDSNGRRGAPGLALVGLGLVLLAGAAPGLASGGGVPADAAREDDPTYAGEVAAILREHCVRCHHPDGSAPFSLATYDEAHRRADRIAEAVHSGQMPPWLPDTDGRTFIGARILPTPEKEILRAWAAAGAPAGAPPEALAAIEEETDLWCATVPELSGAWALGPPDLVVQLPAYSMPASGRDVYRNLVVPVPVEEERWVKAVDLRPGDTRAVHHARMMVDYTSSSREEDRLEEGPGFDGMEVRTQAGNPDGHFVGWTPGKGILPPMEGMAWRVDPETDIVAQLHLKTTGREETVRGELGLYFADGPPTRHPAVIIISSFLIDIPPGDPDWRISNSFTLPVPVDVLSVYPHAHYLGKEMKVTAVRPDGREVELIHIPDWDPDWQDEYRFRKPVRLPAGTVIVKEFSFDNSADNPDNPFDPPQRVVYGSAATDEMADVILQVLPRNREERARLLEAQAWQHDAEDMAYMATMELRRGQAALGRGDPEGAIPHFQESLQYRSDNVEALAGLARAFVLSGDATSAGFIADRAMQLSGGRSALALDALAAVRAASGDGEGAVEAARRALALARDRGEGVLADSLEVRIRRYGGGG